MNVYYVNGVEVYADSVEAALKDYEFYNDDPALTVEDHCGTCI